MVLVSLWFSHTSYPHTFWKTVKMHFLTIFMISHLLEIHGSFRNNPSNLPRNPSFLDFLFKTLRHCFSDFQYEIHSSLPNSAKLPRHPAMSHPDFFPWNMCFFITPQKGTSWKSLLISFSQTQWSIYLLSEAFYTVSQALSTCSLAFCPIIMLSLDSLEVLLLLHWAFCPPSLIIYIWILMPKGICKPVFHYSLFLGKNS